MRNSIKVPIKPCKGLSDHAYGVVHFCYSGNPRKGVFVHEIARNPDLIANGHEVILQGYGSIRLHLTWPGYPTTVTHATIHCTQLTKAELARKVCDHLTQLFQKCATQPVAGHLSQWRVGPNAITTGDVMLASIVGMGDGIWQADLELMH